MEGNKLVSGCGLFALVTLIVCGIAIGIATRNFWIGLGVIFGLWITIGAIIYYVVNDDFSTYLWTPGCFGLLFFLYIKSGTMGQWWWMVAWLLTAFSHAFAGIYAREQKRPAHGTIAGLMALLSLGAGLTNPEQISSFLSIKATAETIVLTSQAFSVDRNAIWMWITLIAALIVLGIAWYQGYRESEEKNFTSLAGIGFILLFVATWLSKLNGGWWWSLPWAFAALVLWHAAQDLRQYSFGRSAGNFGIFLSLLCLLIGIGGPYLAGRGWSVSEFVTQKAQPAPTLSQTDMTATQPAPVIQTATAAAQSATSSATSPPLSPTLTLVPTVQAERTATQVKWNTSAAWKAIGEFLLAAVKSVWGIFHLLMFALLGYSWLRRGWGSLLLPLAFLLAVGITGGLLSSFDEILTRFISLSPAGWMRNLLHFSVERLGQAGWGIVMLGIVVAIGLLPASYQIATTQYRLRNVSSIKRLLGSQIAYEYVERSGVDTVLTVLNLIITPIVSLGLLVALWVALRQIAQEENWLLTAWGIPDLAIPNWRPVWQLPYWVLAAVVAIAQIILIPVKRRFGVRLSGIPAETNPWYILVGTFIFALFVPAGVLLFLVGQMVAHFLSVPLIGRGIAQLEEEKRREEEERRKKEIKKQRQREEQKRREEERKQLEQERQRLLQEEEKSVLKGERIWISPTPLASMAVLDNLLYCLAENGYLFCPIMASNEFALAIKQGQALFAFKEHQLLVIGNDKDVLWVDKQSGEIVKQATLSSPSDKAVLNPYGTMLAWVSAADQTVKVLVLEAGREFTLLSGLGLAPALAFSADGRYIAVGNSEGNILIMDFATRKTAAMLVPPESSQRNRMVQAIYGRRGGGWIGIYTDRQIVLWDTHNQIEKTMRSNRTILGFDFHAERGRLALGLTKGILRVLDEQLNRFFEETVQEKEITCVCFSQDGQRLFTIGGKTEVRRINL